MINDYWRNLTSKRIRRRQALALSAGTAFLAACGGSDTPGGGRSARPSGVKGDSSGLVSPIEDTSKQATRGGVYKFYNNGDPPTLDFFQSISQLETSAMNVYSRFFEAKRGPAGGVAEYVPSLAESFEWSGDGLQMTLKLRQGVKWHNKPPVNGRAFDVSDVLYTWDRFSRVGQVRSYLANAINPTAPIVSITSPDARTVAIKLARPTAYLPALLGQRTSGTAVPIVPKEAESGFDMRNEMIGTGPFMLEKYTPSVGLTMVRHPDFWEKDRPFVDRMELPIITEYAQGLAQLKAGAVYTYPARAEDILQIKRDIKDLKMYQSPIATNSTTTLFGWARGSRFLDERVRKAFSMAIDRDLWIDTINNVPNFTAAGLPVETRWNNAVLPSESYDGWLDPKGKDFGANAAFFNFDLPEAKKLMAAAGLGSGTDLNWYASVNFDTNQNQIIEGMVAEAGFRIKRVPVQYATEFIPKYRDVKGNFEGISHNPSVTIAYDPVAFLALLNYSKGGLSFNGFDAGGKGDQSGDPYIDGQLEKATGELDHNKRLSIVHDLQRYTAGKMYDMLFPGAASGFSLVWPAVGNFLAFGGDGPRRNDQMHYWIDQTKAPIAKT